MSKDGKTIQKIKEVEHDTNFGDMHEIIRHNENTFIVVYRDASDDGFLKTFNISADGNTISEVAKLEYNTAMEIGLPSNVLIMIPIFSLTLIPVTMAICKLLISQQMVRP